MKRPHVIALCVVATLALLGVLSLRSGGSGAPGSRAQNAISTNPPVTLRWIKTGNFEGHFGTTFWATNNTTNEVMLTLYLLETNNGTRWVTACQLLQPLTTKLKNELTDVVEKLRASYRAATGASALPKSNEDANPEVRRLNYELYKLDLEKKKYEGQVEVIKADYVKRLSPYLPLK